MIKLISAAANSQVRSNKKKVLKREKIKKKIKKIRIKRLKLLQRF